jgi:hypothetical protein
MEHLITMFSEYGLPGIVTGAALWFAWRKDKQYIKLQEQIRIIYERMLAKESKQQEKYYDLALETTMTLRELSGMELVEIGSADEVDSENDEEDE